MSSRYMLNHLGAASEHTSGYERSKFTHWVDANGDGCDARDEVLIAEAVTQPRVTGECELVGGAWRSRYDGARTTNPSGFDIDHMVPLNEAWQSGAWNWSPATRRAFANDLGYRASLIAVTASSNRSKSDREPNDWMPDRARYACTYTKSWVAVKWRWRLNVNGAERRFLANQLADCGWPQVPKPGRPAITTGSTGSGTAPTPTPTQTETSGRQTVGYAVWPGAFCDEKGWYGYTSAGTLMRCKTSATDSRYRWRSA